MFMTQLWDSQGMHTMTIPPIPSHNDDCEYPWQQGPALLDLLREWDGNTDFELPDDRPQEPNRLRFTGGSMEGIVSHWNGPSSLDEQAEARAVCPVLDALPQFVHKHGIPA